MSTPLYARSTNPPPPPPPDVAVGCPPPDPPAPPEITVLPPVPPADPEVVPELAGAAPGEAIIVPATIVFACM